MLESPHGMLFSTRARIKFGTRRPQVQILSPRLFTKISRSAIVSTRWIERLTRDRHGDGILTLRSGETLRVSRSFRREVEDALQGR